MVYARSRTAYRRRRVYRRGSTSLKKPQNLRRFVQKVINKNAENKSMYLDGSAGVSVTTSGVFYDLTGSITRGTLSTERVGDQIRMMRLMLKQRLFVADAYNIMRVIVGYSKTPIDNPTAVAAIGGQVLGLWDQDRYPAYILMDRTLTLGAGANNLASILGPSINKSLRLWRTAYSAANAVTSGQLFYFLISDSAAAPNPTAYFQARLTFQDL